MLSKNKKELFDKIYYNPENPAGFSSKHQLYKEAKKKDPTVTKEDVNYFLNGDKTYTLHRPRRLRFKRAKCFAAGLGTDYHFDLADMQKLSRYNNGHKYILVGIDVLSKKVYAGPIKSKKKIDMENAFDILLKEMPMTPHRIFTDRGT